MKYSKDIDYFRAILICLVILVHIVNFGNIYPLMKGSILAFMMPSFLVLTGFLVNIEKTVQQFAQYILKLWLPYMILVMGYAILSLYFPVRDGISELNASTVMDVLFVRSIGPYWFLHAMMVCGIIYYTAFHMARRWDVTARYCIFGSLLIAVALLTPFLNLKAAFYYFVGVGVRLYAQDISRIYVKSLWPIIPFSLLVFDTENHDWGKISVLVCVLCFFSFSSYLVSFAKGRTTEIMEYMGRNTFPIYLFHPVFTMLSKYTLPLLAFDTTGLLHTFVTIVMCIVGSLGIAKLLDTWHLSIVFGKKQILR